MVDPNDFARPIVFDPNDERWADSEKNLRVGQFCRGSH